MWSAVSFVCINTFERKLGNGQESNLDEYAHDIFLTLVGQEQKVDLKFVFVRIQRKKEFIKSVSLMLGYWQAN